MVPQISVEGGGVRGGVGVIVVGKFGEREIIDPVVLLRRDVGAKIGFERLIRALCKAVRLQVMHGGEVELGVEQ